MTSSSLAGWRFVFTQDLPAFFWRYIDGQLTDEYRLFATSHSPLSMEDFAAKLRPFCEDAFAANHANEDDWQRFLNIIEIINIDVISGAGADMLAEKDQPKTISGQARDLLSGHRIKPVWHNCEDA